MTDMTRATPRRMGADESLNREALLDAAQELMLEEGYAAVTTRRVAARAGLKPQLVHYYFESMDQLLLDLVRRTTARSRETLARVLASPNPVRRLWEWSSDTEATALQIEMMALANHRKAIRAELADGAKRLRRMQVDALSNVLERLGIVNDVVRPDALMAVIGSLGRMLVMEKSLGVTTGHRNTRALVEHYLRQFETQLEGSTDSPA
jgi:AcrR family transcriptional regulator